MIFGGANRTWGVHGSILHSGKAGTGNREFHRVDERGRPFPPELFRRRRGAEAKERPPHRTAKDAGDCTATGRGDPLPLPTVAVDADKCTLTKRGRPCRTVAIEADAVRLSDAPEPAAQMQFSFTADGVFRQAIAIHLGHHEPAMIRRDRYAVWKPQPLRHDTGPAARRDEKAL